MQTKLTQAVVKKFQADPPAKDTTVFDTELKRFALRVKPGKANAAGQRAKPSMWFFIRYTSPVTKAECRMSVAKANLSVDDARKIARGKLAEVDQGRDPAAEQAAKADMPSIKELAALYADSADFKKKTAKVQANDRARIDHHIVHHIGGKKAGDVTPQVARKLVRDITTDDRIGGRKKKLGGAGAARKAARLLAALLAWGKAEGLLAAVPFSLKDLKLAGDGQRDATITSIEEYAGLFGAMDAMMAEGKLRADVRAFFILVASTGLRRGEAQALTWGQVDLDRRQITLSTSKGATLARKAGRAAGRELVGVPPVAAEALAQIRPKAVSDAMPVFVPEASVRAGGSRADRIAAAAAKGARSLSVNRDWVAVRERAGLPADLTIHGLRHSVGTVAALRGMPTHDIQALLRHRQLGTTARYIHLAKMSGGLADEAMADVLPAASAPSGEVVRMRRS